MKRCLKKVVDWFDKVKDKATELPEKPLNIIGMIVGIIVVIGVFLYIDTAPATAVDYEPLERQALIIQQNPEMLFKEDCTCHISDGVIEVEFENDECKLVIKYNQEFEMLSVSKIDNCTHWTVAIMVAFLMGVIGYFMVIGIWAVVICLFLILGALISKLYKRIC